MKLLKEKENRQGKTQSQYFISLYKQSSNIKIKDDCIFERKGLQYHLICLSSH